MFKPTCFNDSCDYVDINNTMMGCNDSCNYEIMNVSTVRGVTKFCSLCEYFYIDVSRTCSPPCPDNHVIF